METHPSGRHSVLVVLSRLTRAVDISLAASETIAAVSRFHNQLWRIKEVMVRSQRSRASEELDLSKAASSSEHQGMTCARLHQRLTTLTPIWQRGVNEANMTSASPARQTRRKVQKSELQKRHTSSQSTSACPDESTAKMNHPEPISAPSASSQTTTTMPAVAQQSSSTTMPASSATADTRGGTSGQTSSSLGPHDSTSYAAHSNCRFAYSAELRLVDDLVSILAQRQQEKQKSAPSGES